MSNPEVPQKLELLLNPQDNEWVVAVGRFMLNMGIIEAATQFLIGEITPQGDLAPVHSAELAARIGFIRNRFPRANSARHQWAMNTLQVATKLAGFRNIVAHSSLIITGHADGSRRIQGLLDMTPRDKNKFGDLVSLQELTTRVAESEAVARDFCEMQNDFPGPPAPGPT